MLRLLSGAYLFLNGEEISYCWTKITCYEDFCGPTNLVTREYELYEGFIWFSTMRFHVDRVVLEAAALGR